MSIVHKNADTIMMKFTNPFPYLLITAFCLSGAFLGAQTADPAGENALPRTFREISLGMGLEELKAALQADELFYFRGDRDVSFLPAREERLVETTGFSFIRRAFFQLREGQLFIMAFTMDTELIDHYSVFTSFTQKYGPPLSLDPKQAVWETDETRIAIERPLTVKYIDKQVFNQIIEESGTVESSEVYRRQEFLDAF
ncbi:hypothetical protein FACS1894141_0340 [Spirochaetia bacterium]|nr:hypothetical protein FACS1894141_0340 [Spirochaetia bacterium]